MNTSNSGTQARTTRFRSDGASATRGGSFSPRGRSRTNNVKSFSSSSRSSAPRRSSGGGRGRRGNPGERIDINRFIQKAEPVQEQVVYASKHTFSDFEITDALKRAIASREYITPSPIQDQSIPASLQGRDILGIANTGTGKTAAFLIPIIQALLTNKDAQALVLAPTRELAIQIQNEFQLFTRSMRLYSTVCVGGAPIYGQIRDLDRGVRIIIGTPGRVDDLIKRNKITLANISHVVLDEADRMLDMGFVDDITRMLGGIKKDAQKMFFSATFAKPIEKLTEKFLDNPCRVEVKQQQTSKNIDQDVVRVRNPEDKFNQLHTILENDKEAKVLVFAETKRDVDRLARDLAQKGHKADSLHGDKRQRERNRTLAKFRSNDTRILVATDVAARGLDIHDISHVINYEVPQTYDTYVHRIGRTGRANRQGKALTFVPHR